MNAEAKARILLVDDDEDFLAQQRRLFEAGGYSVRTADGTAAARAALAESAPDVAVVALMMGEMDAGIVLAYEIKKAHPGLPVIMVSSVTRETGMIFDLATPEARRWLKFDQVLAKPVRHAQLSAAVEAQLQRVGLGAEART